MNMIPKIRQGEEITIEKLNALIDKVNAIEASKRELEVLRDNLHKDMEKNNALIESIYASQGVVQQLAQSNSLETLTSLLNSFIFDNTKPSIETAHTQRWGMRQIAGTGSISIYLEEVDANGEWHETASFNINQGQDGAQGEPGPQGDPGPEGPRGSIGPRGYRGITGATGEGAQVEAAYVSHINDMSLLPSDLESYLRIQIYSINSEGVKTLTDTRYIPTQGYIYFPELYTLEEGGDTVSYVRFRRTTNLGTPESGLVDQGWRVTGPKGKQGDKGDTGAPGTGLTCSNLIHFTDNHIFTRNLAEGETAETSLEMLLTASTSEVQKDLINSLGLPEASSSVIPYGLIPLDTATIPFAKKFTLIHKVTIDGVTQWDLLKGVNFNGVDLKAQSDGDNPMENKLAQIVTIGGSDYPKLVVGASFLHQPSNDNEFYTYLYTVYDRPNLSTSPESSYYVLVKNTINAGIEKSIIDGDSIEGYNITLPDSILTEGFTYEYQTHIDAENDFGEPRFKQGNINAGHILLRRGDSVVTDIGNEPKHPKDLHAELITQGYTTNSAEYVEAMRQNDNLIAAQKLLSFANTSGFGLRGAYDYFKLWATSHGDTLADGSPAYHTDLIPSTNKRQNLGSSYNQFKNIYTDKVKTSEVNADTLHFYDGFKSTISNLITPILTFSRDTTTIDGVPITYYKAPNVFSNNTSSTNFLCIINNQTHFRTYSPLFRAWDKLFIPINIPISIGTSLRIISYIRLEAVDDNIKLTIYDNTNTNITNSIAQNLFEIGLFRLGITF